MSFIIKILRKHFSCRQVIKYFKLNKFKIFTEYNSKVAKTLKVNATFSDEYVFQTAEETTDGNMTVMTMMKTILFKDVEFTYYILKKKVHLGR